MPVTKENLEHVFTYQPPRPDQIAKYTAIRTAGLVLGNVILQVTPICADQQAAIRHVREAVMTANAAVALDGEI